MYDFHMLLVFYRGGNVEGNIVLLLANFEVPSLSHSLDSWMAISFPSPLLAPVTIQKLLRLKKSPLASRSPDISLVVVHVH